MKSFSSIIRLRLDEKWHGYPKICTLNCTSDLSFTLIQSTMYIEREFVSQKVDEIVRLYILASHMCVCASVMDDALKLMC